MNHPTPLQRGHSLWLDTTGLIDALRAPAALAARLYLAQVFFLSGLTVVNFVAVLSLTEIAPAALQQHITWGVLLAVLVLFGLGQLNHRLRVDSPPPRTPLRQHPPLKHLLCLSGETSCP